MLPAKPLIAVGELAFAIAGAREIEVVAVANGLAEGKGFQLGIVEFGVFLGHFDLRRARTLAGFQDRCIQPLCHLSVAKSVCISVVNGTAKIRQYLVGPPISKFSKLKVDPKVDPNGEEN